MPARGVQTPGTAAVATGTEPGRAGHPGVLAVEHSGTPAGLCQSFPGERLKVLRLGARSLINLMTLSLKWVATGVRVEHHRGPALRQGVG